MNTAYLKNVLFLAVIISNIGCSKIHKSYINSGNVIIQSDSLQANSPCREFMNYAPDEQYPHHTPMRWIRMNFHVVANKSGDKNFTLEKAVPFVKRMLEIANKKLRNNKQMSLPVGNNTPVLRINYQYVLTPNPDETDNEGVYIHYDDDLFYYIKTGKNRNLFSREVYDKYKIQHEEVLNVFMLEHHPDSIKSSTYKSSVDGVGFNSWCKIVGCYQHLYDTTFHEDGTYKVGGPHHRDHILNHEIGHTLGLAHTWNTNDGCDDTPNHPNCWDHNTKRCLEIGAYSNNYMDYNNRRSAMSPCQIAKVQYNLSKPNSTLNRFLLPTWCEHRRDTITIEPWDDVEWKSRKDLEGDIIIERNGRLTIYCEVSLPKGARVIVKPKGELILNGGSITNKCGDLWEGIEVWSSKKNKAKVIMINGATLENSVHSNINIQEPSN